MGGLWKALNDKSERMMGEHARACQITAIRLDVLFRLALWRVAGFTKHIKGRWR